MSNVKQYVEIFYPGSLFANVETKPVDNRNVTIDLPKGAYGYRFFERTEVEQDGETLIGNKKNYSGIHYKGTVYTLEELEQQFPSEEHRILISNIKNNGHKKAIRTIVGNWQPFEDNDVLLNS
jgi:hypothetical protein